LDVPDDDRLLVIMRHAKAEPFAAEDRLRRLTDRGRAAAADAGRWAADHGVAPDQALVSPAVRTRETWAAFAAGLGTAVEAVYDASLYSAGTETAMECLRSVEDDVGCAVLVGHNPTVASLVQLLGDGAGDADALRRVSSGYPPASVALFRLPARWQDLDFAGARLEAAYVGQG
jgi:phosphohistidine phosphatase